MIAAAVDEVVAPPTLTAVCRGGRFGRGRDGRDGRDGHGLGERGERGGRVDAGDGGLSAVAAAAVDGGRVVEPAAVAAAPDDGDG